MNRQQTIDKYWNICAYCSVPFKRDDLLVAFVCKRVTVNKEESMAKECVQMDKTQDSLGLSQSIHYHRSCYLTMAGDGMDFWKHE